MNHFQKHKADLNEIHKCKNLGTISMNRAIVKTRSKENHFLFRNSTAILHILGLSMR